MKNRQSSRSTRIDLRIPNDLLETIQKLASERFNAPIHHISGKPEITPVIIQLIQLGIGTLSGKHPDSFFDSTADIYPDNIVTVDRLETAIESLREELSGIGAIGEYLARLTAIEKRQVFKMISITVGGNRLEQAFDSPTVARPLHPSASGS